jgi:hypothetical protein
MDVVCRLRKEKVEASKCAFLYTVYPAAMEYIRNRRWHYDKGKRTAEMICGKVQRLKDTADDEEGASSHRTPAPRKVAADLETPQMSKRRMVDMAWWFSDPDNFGDGTDGAGVRAPPYHTSLICLKAPPFPRLPSAKTHTAQPLATCPVVSSTSVFTT